MSSEQLVEVGQVWEMGRGDRREQFVVSGVGHFPLRCGCSRHVFWQHADGTLNGICEAGMSGGGAYGFALVSPAPAQPAPNREACKAFCGWTYGSFTGAGREQTPQRLAWNRVMGHQRPDEGSLPTRDKHAWCSVACRDARLPPIDAPAEAKDECLPWCGNDLPPAGVVAYGFLTMNGELIESFKMSRAGFEKRHLVLGWCSDSCRAAVIANRCKSSTPAKAEKVPVAMACSGGCGTLMVQEPNVTSWRCKTCGQRFCDYCRLERPDVAVRVFKAGRSRYCNNCAAWAESNIADKMSFETSGTPLPANAPERLPRNVLAVDFWDDCL